MATKLDAVKNLADRYRGVTRDQDRDTEKDIEKRQATASLAQSYREKAAAKKMAEEKEERDRLSFNARLADRIRTPARYENVARLTPIEEQTDEEIEAKIGSLRKELEKTRSGSLVSRTKESLGALLGFGKDGEEKKQAWEETQDALYTYEAEKQRRTDEKLLAIAETMSDEEIEARLDELDATTPGVIWDAMAKLGLATGKGERAEKKNESSLLSNYLYERKRERALDSYTLPYSSDADAEQYIKAGMEIEAPKGGLPDWDDRRLYAALTGEIVTAFGLTGAGTGGSAEDKALQYLTDEERNIVAYYVGRGQKDRALGYLDAITDDLMDRQAEDAYETAESFAADHPVIGSAARIASGVGRVGGVIGTAGQWFKNEITGEHEPLDASSPWFAANRTSQALESGVLSNIDSELGRFLAQTGFSIADNVTNRLLFGNTFALTAMGMQAAGDGAYAAAEAGASPEEALVLGIAAGGIEYLTEKIPFDHLTDMLKSAGSSGIKQTLKEVAKQMGSEALEEATSEYANFIVDAVVRGDESEYNQYIAQLVANGMDFSDAEREAVLQYYVENPLLAAAGGALSGGVMGGGASVISHAAESSLGRVDIDDRDRVSLTLQSLGETAKRADALYDSVYQVVSGKGNEADREAVASSDAARTFVAEQQRARSRRAERAKKSAERAERKLSRSTSRTEGTRLAEGTSSEADARSDSAYGEHGARLRETYGERLTEPAYAEAFSRFYEAGRAGISFEKADAIDPASTVPKQERYRMFAAGQNDVPVSDTGLRGDTFDGWSAEEITTVNKLAHALGVQVVGVESVRAAGADGTYRAARARLVGNTIEVARNATSRETVMQVLGHEFTHRLKQLSADDYARLEAFALSHSQTADEVRARYASLNLSEQDMAEEITAAYAEMLFSDEQTVQRMANEDRGLARRILDFIKDIIGRIRGKVPSELTQAERLWRNALHSAEGRVQRLSRNAGKESGAATKNTAGKDGGKFSIETIPGTNNQYVQADRPVMKGDDPRQWAKYVENYLAEKVLEGEELYIRSAEGDMLTINQTTAWKMGDRAKRNRKGEVVEFLGVSDYDAKTNAALHIDEIVKVSKFSRRAADYNSRHDADHFSYRTAYFMDYDGKYYKLEVSVKEHMGDKTVYNIGNIEKRSSPLNGSSQINGRSGTSRDNADALRRTSTADTISQNEDNVNSQSMQISEKYSLDAMGKTEALLEQYGALPEGEREGSAAGREVKVPRRTAKDNRIRRTVRTVMEAAVTSDEIAGDLKEKIEAGEFSYLPTSNKTLLDNAETLVKEKGFDAVLSEWRAHVESTREANDRMLGVGEYLLIHALKTKDANLAGTLAVELSVEATASGRSVSAVRMIKRLGPAAKVYEVMRTVEKLSETTIERRGSRKAVEELSEKRDALMSAYLGHEDAMLDARHEAETLEFLRDNLKASEKSEEKIKKLEAEIRQLRGLLEKSKNPAKRRELGERLETANGDLEKARELAKKQRQSREDAIDDLAAIQERIRKAERSTKQDARRIEKIIEKLRRGGAQAEAAGTAAQEMTAEVSAALAEARERLRAVTAEAGNMHAKYSRILEVDKELHKLGKYTVDSALLEAFVNAKTVKEAEAAGNNILIHVASQVPATFADKWNAWRYLSMLGNVRTHVRNMLGNAVFVPAVRMKNLIGAALEAGGQKDGVRTKDILHSVLGWHDAYRAFAKADFEEMQDIIKSGGKYNPASKIEENRTIYTSKMLRGLEKLRKGNSALLDAEDTIALRLHYSDSLAGYLAANKVNLKTIDDATLDRARAYAMEEAWKATFRDASKTASLLNRLSKTNAFTKIFVEGLVPFKKTPINILKRGVEYSPAGLIRTLTKGLYDVKKSNITAAQFIDGISSGLTGTALVVLGYFLAAAGIIEPGIGDDEKDKFAELQGKQGYALVIEDMSYTIDWLAPAAIPLFVGTSMHTLFHETGEDSPEVMDVLYDVVEPVFEMSMLQGIENALSAVKYGGDGYAVGNILFEGMTGYFGQAVPTVLGQVARTADGTRRTTYTESGAPLASGSRFLQSVMNKTPGLSMLNEPYVDEWGREETTENLAWRIFNTFVSPGYVSTYETSPMEEELKRLHDSTGEDVFPRTAPKYFSADGVRVSMNAKEHTAYQKTMGQTAYHTLTELTGLASYKKAEDALRIKAIDKAYDYAAEMAKKAVLGKDYTPSALVENIEDVTAAGVRVSEYLMFMTAVSEMKSVYGKDGKTVILSKQDQVEEYLRGLSLRAAQKKALWGTLYDSESPWG